MLIKTLCLAPLEGQPGVSHSALLDAARQWVQQDKTAHEAQVLRVLRHIPTDSVVADKSHQGVVAQADEIAAVLSCSFPDAQAAARACAAPAWQALQQAVALVARPLFTLDTESHVPIAPVRQALEGGFRRWILLARAMPTHAAFRDAWLGRHASLVKQLPGVDGYLQNVVVAAYGASGATLAYEDLPIDGLAEMCFADQAAMLASYASDARLPLRDDGRALLARINTLLVQAEAVR